MYCMCFLHDCGKLCKYSSTCLQRPPPPDGRPPAVYGHVINVSTNFNVNVPQISIHLPNADADSNPLVVRVCYITDSVNKSHVFGGHFMPKSQEIAVTCDNSFKVPCCHLATTAIFQIDRNRLHNERCEYGLF